MPVYDINGNRLNAVYDINGVSLNYAYDINGNRIYSKDSSQVDYSNYSYVQKWASKSIANTQGFDIYDGKVFWVSKSGDGSVPANCYVWNLNDGSQALDEAYITVYSGHGNNLSFDFPKLYATPAYVPSRVYINTLTDDFSATYSKKLVLNDGSTDCDACIDEADKNILWSLGHTANHSDTSAPFLISKWNLRNLTDNGDGTYTPELLQTVQTAQPASYYFQGCKFHDGILWYASGYAGTSTNAYVYGVDPNNGDRLYTIDCQTTAEPEGVAFYPDEEAVGGYAMYVGFQGMMLRKYTFGAVSNS